MKYLVIGIATLAMFFSCSDDGIEVGNSTSEESIETVAKSSRIADNVNFSIDQFIATQLPGGIAPPQANEFQFRNLQDCTTVTYVETDTGRDYTLVFDEGGCDDLFGNIHAGTVLVSVSVEDEMVTVVKTFQNYTYNNNSVAGSITSYRDTTSETTAYTSSSNLTITDTEGVVNNRTASHVVTLVEGDDTPDEFSDNVYSVTGSSTNVLSNGNTWTVQNLTAVVRPASCDLYAVSGTKSLNNGTESLLLNYGEGECDGTALLTLNSGEVITVNQF